MENWIGDLKLSVLRLYSGVAEDCFFLDMTLHHTVIRFASHFEGKYFLHFQESMLEEFFKDILPRDAGSNIRRTESSNIFLLPIDFPKKYLNNIPSIWVIWCYLRLSTLQCTRHGSEIAVELRRINMSLCPHIEWSYADYYTSAHVF